MRRHQRQCVQNGYGVYDLTVNAWAKPLVFAYTCLRIGWAMQKEVCQLTKMGFLGEYSFEPGQERAASDSYAAIPSLGKGMNQESAQKLERFYERPSTTGPSSLVDVEEVSATKGELLVPAVREVNLALLLSNHTVSWRDSLGRQTKEVRPGTVALCRFGESVEFELRDPVDYAVVLLRNEALEQVRGETRQCLGEDLQAQPALEDPTLRELMQILHREKRDGFQNGPFFLDGVATALASYLVRQYSITSRREQKFTGGISPSMLRRSIEFMDARLDGTLRLSELAREAGLSASHFVRSFRQSTGKTPYQYLLLRRVERARLAMQDRRASLAEVALVSGFADQHHLSRVFRRVTGLTPSNYRRSL